MRHFAILILLFLSSFISRSQPIKESCTRTISLLTCAPGTDLYSFWGHTAIRIKDSARGMDVIYNYGIFDDSDPLFYIHFTKGIMRYSVAAETMSDFMSEYEYEHRAVFEQVLNLSCSEKDRLYEALRTNTLEENRFYNYHFHTDNCTTRAGRVIESNLSEPLSYANTVPLNNPDGKSGISFRDMIHEYLNKEQAYWPELGIDFLLGSHLDKKPTNLEAIHFLPDYLYRGMDSAMEGTKPLVLQRQAILRFPEKTEKHVWFTPTLFFSFLLVLAIVFFLLRDKSVFANALLIYDIVLFSLSGLIGILITCLWLGRVDDVCRDNINILWAIPTHAIIVFFIRKKAAWIKYYFLVTAVIAAVLLIGFPFWFQRMNLAVYPILGIIIFRSFTLYINRFRAEKNSV
jgi:hypothetical protein